MFGGLKRGGFFGGRKNTVITPTGKPFRGPREEDATVIDFRPDQGDEYWNPKYPEFSTRPEGAEMYDFFLKEDGPWPTAPPEWEYAPDHSHLLCFRFFDKRDRPYLPYNIIEIRFKPTTRRATTHYGYYIDDSIYAEGVFELLKMADHPGEVVQRVIIPDKVPYRRLA